MADAERHKRFEGQQRKEGEEPVTFEIGDETFTCIHGLPSMALERLSSDEWTVLNMRLFIEGVLVDEDIERFRAILEAKDVIISTQELSDMCMWLIGAISDRPTRSPSGSRNGKATTGRTSTARSAAQGAAAKT